MKLTFGSDKSELYKMLLFSFLDVKQNAVEVLDN